MKYELNQTLSIVSSGEFGQVVGRAEYAYAAPAYLLRYATAQGAAVEQWWAESALEPVVSS